MSAVNNYFGTPPGIVVSDLSQQEINQISNINSNIITPAAWSYLASMDQSVSTLSSPNFQKILLPYLNSTNPSYSFVGDTDSGIYHGSNDDEICITTNGIIRLLVSAGDIATRNATLTLTNNFRIGPNPYVFTTAFSNGETYIAGNVGIGTAVGTDALTVLGNIKCSGIVSQTGNNCWYGTGAGISRTTGTNNTIMGDGAFALSLIGSNNSGLGTGVLSKSTADFNTGAGSYCLSNLTSGTTNTCYGAVAGQILTTGAGNTCIGYNATVLQNSTTNAVAIGYGTLVGTNAIGIGYGANAATNTITIGNSTNTTCLFKNTDITTFTGLIATGGINSQAGNNCWIGTGAGISRTTGIRNTIIGDGAGPLLTTVNSNTAIGYQALAVCVSAYNNAIGSGCLSALTSGDSNTVVGTGAGASLTTGSGCTIIGNLADGAASSTNSIAIGYTAKSSGNNSISMGYGTIAATNEIAFGNATNTTCIFKNTGVSTFTGNLKSAGTITAIKGIGSCSTSYTLGNGVTQDFTPGGIDANCTRTGIYMVTAWCDAIACAYGMFWFRDDSTHVLASNGIWSNSITISISGSNIRIVQTTGGTRTILVNCTAI